MDITHIAKELLGALADDSKKALDDLLDRPAPTGRHHGGTADTMRQWALLAELTTPPATTPAAAGTITGATALADSLAALPRLLDQLTAVADRLDQTLRHLPSLPGLPADTATAVREKATTAAATAKETTRAATAAPQDAVSSTVQKLRPLGW
ncbi:hypothetical protein [Streptomyces rubradiris]|uniref:Uncharacterized protein n=1 Tax=Streptomyces rubradiris TaxID=285531 RepID=A0ABQ3R9I8_STRRR|nr:hypothetical protein [Streptomyces rubradiris]GHH00071.1 hypothetical protein GCM10018792_14120 [Streptomyces rubradiris]GHI52511.1 hypothetical protein Srubr_23570 [Streptomyces rubradiris]